MIHQNGSVLFYFFSTIETKVQPYVNAAWSDERRVSIEDYSFTKFYLFKRISLETIKSYSALCGILRDRKWALKWNDKQIKATRSLASGVSDNFSLRSFIYGDRTILFLPFTPSAETHLCDHVQASCLPHDCFVTTFVCWNKTARRKATLSCPIWRLF